VEAASITWRPLGLLLVEKGLLTEEELEFALTKQGEDNRRLGEILVETGLVSGPALAHVLAEQLGVELSAEQGFGTGLRFEIVRRHEKRAVEPFELPETNGSGTHALETLDPVEAPETETGGEPDDPPPLLPLPDESEPFDEPPFEPAARLAELEAECAEQARSIERLTDELVEREAELDGRDAALEELKAELDALQAQPDTEPEATAATEIEESVPTEPQPSAHVMLAPEADRYEIVTADGPPPAVGGEVELFESRFRVCKVGRSPFPADRRPCAFLERIVDTRELDSGQGHAIEAQARPQLMLERRSEPLMLEAGLSAEALPVP